MKTRRLLRLVLSFESDWIDAPDITVIAPVVVGVPLVLPKALATLNVTTPAWIVQLPV